MDRWDVLAAAGMLLIGVAVYLMLGMAATVAYAGVVAVLLGVVGALGRRWSAATKIVQGKEER